MSGSTTYYQKGESVVQISKYEAHMCAMQYVDYSGSVWPTVQRPSDTNAVVLDLQSKLCAHSRDVTSPLLCYVYVIVTQYLR